MGTPVRHRRPDNLTLLTRIFAETSRLTEHGGSARAGDGAGNGPGAETSLSVSRHALGGGGLSSGRSAPRSRGVRALT